MLGSGNGNGYSSGYGYSHGYGNDNGHGYGYGNGYGNGYGYGYSDGNGYSYGNDPISQAYFAACANAGTLPAEFALKVNNLELRRMLIEALGYDKFFQEIEAEVVHQDVDGYGNPRQLLQIPMAGTQLGYLRAVRVVCPTTGRIYNLGVPSSMETCQDAVASTFGKHGKDYQPIRES